MFANELGSNVMNPPLEAVLEEGIRRLSERGTWKGWLWPNDDKLFYDAESFRYARCGYPLGLIAQCVGMVWLPVIYLMRNR